MRVHMYIFSNANTFSTAHNALADDEVFNYESSNENKVNVCRAWPNAFIQ